MSQKQRRGAGESAPSAPSFDPVNLRYRRDGWTPERQVAFIRALAECGCVRDACRRVGMSPESAYELARRPDAQSFRVAWDVAMDNAVRRIGDEAFSRCIHGVVYPHFYKGEQVGEHRRYDERLTMFLLRYRDPLRYGKHRDRAEPAGHPEEKALALKDALLWVETDARREAAGQPRHVVTDLAAVNDDEAAEERRRLARLAAEDAAEEAALADLDADEEGGFTLGVARGSSTSVPKPNRAARRAAASRERGR
jgi:hypothetical protein